uniref:Uncharacterized protein n=1 Tax=Aegilops tauschii subsp. strangulata TaxID=200361 RepID=A0A453ATW8_AEGTS
WGLYTANKDLAAVCCYHDQFIWSNCCITDYSVRCTWSLKGSESVLEWATICDSPRLLVSGLRCAWRAVSSDRCPSLLPVEYMLAEPPELQ